MLTNAHWLMKTNIAMIEKRLINVGTILLAGDDGQTFELHPVALIYEVDSQIGYKILDLLDQRDPQEGRNSLRRTAAAHTKEDTILWNLVISDPIRIMSLISDALYGSKGHNDLFITLTEAVIDLAKEIDGDRYSVFSLAEDPEEPGVIQMASRFHRIGEAMT